MKKICLLLAFAGMSILSIAHATTITETFATDPLQNGWKIFGNTNLFHWNPTNENLEVTWDSTQTNSYCYQSLGTTLTRDDTFSLSFDLQVNDAIALQYGAELAVGLFKFSSATNAVFSRSGGTSPNLFEFDYFPDTGYGDSVDATLIDTNGDFGHLYFVYDSKTLNPGVTYQITLSHTAGTTNISGQILTNGVLFSSLPFVYSAPITDFRLDTLSISSYQDDGFGDSILAHGVVDNFVVTLPPPPIQSLTVALSNSIPQIQFTSRANWLYTLQRTTDFQSWTDVPPITPGVAGMLLLSDTNAPADKAFYRVRADLP